MTGTKPTLSSNQCSECSQLLELLRAIKGVFAGEAAPNWVNRYETSMLRGHYLDRIDWALNRAGNKPHTVETTDVASLRDNRKLDELLYALGHQRGNFMERVAILKWLGPAEKASAPVGYQCPICQEKAPQSCYGDACVDCANAMGPEQIAELRRRAAVNGDEVSK